MILAEILAAKRKAVSHLRKIDPLKLLPAKGTFLNAIKNSDVAIIAELKSQSPSEDIIDPHYDVRAIAEAYGKGGASALSVLTDTPFFGGSFDDIRQVKSVSNLPVLCKDFIIDPLQVYHARAVGADACLLIVRCLNDQNLKRLFKTIESLEMDALVEVFDEHEAKRALDVGATLIGVNNRNLDTLELDTDNIKRLRKYIPNSVTLISLSGAKTPEDLHYYGTTYDGVLAGTALMKARDKVGFLQKATSKR